MDTLKKYQPNEKYDSTKGFYVGSKIYMFNEEWECLDATPYNAKWANNGIQPFNRNSLNLIAELTFEDLNILELDAEKCIVIIKNGKINNTIFDKVECKVTEDFECDKLYYEENYITTFTATVPNSIKLQTTEDTSPLFNAQDITVTFNLHSPNKQNWTKGKLKIYVLSHFI